MFAVVDILGQQFKVSEKTKYFVPRLKDEPNADITFSNVLIFGNDEGTKIGNPFLEGVTVTAKVLAHVKDDKVIVYKKKEGPATREKERSQAAVNKN